MKVPQTTQTNLVMDKNPLVDRKVSLRKLGDKPFGLGMVYARSEGDVSRGVAVRICLISAPWTFEDEVVPGPFSSTSGASVRCPSWTDWNHKPIALPSDRFERRSEPAVGHPFGFAVALPVTSGVLQSFEIFYGNEGPYFLAISTISCATCQRRVVVWLLSAFLSLRRAFLAYLLPLSLRLCSLVRLRDTSLCLFPTSSPT